MLIDKGLVMLLRWVAIFFSVTGFLSFIITGENGFQAYNKVKSEVAIENENINGLSKELTCLKVEVSDWKSDEFLAEKVAREELLLGMPGEKVYIMK